MGVGLANIGEGVNVGVITGLVGAEVRIGLAEVDAYMPS